MHASLEPRSDKRDLDLSELRSALGAKSLVLDPDLIASYRFDRSNAGTAGMPVAVVRARSTEEVSETLRFASRYLVPVVPRGAGTSLAGGSLAVDGCIVLSLECMDAITIDPQAGIAIAQPGALNVAIKDAAREYGLWYPPDPSSYEICSIGGNIATNAGGLCCVKYGVTTDYVLGMEVVLASGSVIRLGGSTVKDVAGYDLKRLFVGSEGTLGVVTEATLRLRPLPAQPVTLVAIFPDIASAGRAVSEITAHERPALLELMDQTTVRAVEARMHMGLDENCGALLLARSDAGEHRARSEIAVIESISQTAGASEVFVTDDPDTGEQLLAARRMAITAVEELGRVLIEDVGVPLPLIADLVQGIERIAGEHDTMIATVGHAGDGNFHPLVVFDPSDNAATARAEHAFGAIMDLALELGGTITGEHGVGTLKRPWLERQLGAGALEICRAVKHALDPLEILNPGKALPPETW